MNKQFKSAVTRKPGKNFLAGITTANLGIPNYQTALQQHSNYCKVLEKCGLTVTTLEPIERYPDGEFVEDTAILAGKVAIITCPGDKRRQGEQAAVATVLQADLALKYIAAPGLVDGGDILKVASHYYIGQSARTNPAGAKQLAKFLAAAGFSSSIVQVKSVLHLKTGVTYIGHNTLMCVPEFANAKQFANFNKIALADNDSYCANCLVINGNLLVPAGFPSVLAKLNRFGKEHGLEVVPIEMSEFQKMDGGLTCLSVLY